MGVPPKWLRKIPWKWMMTGGIPILWNLHIWSASSGCFSTLLLYQTATFLFRFKQFAKGSVLSYSQQLMWRSVPATGPCSKGLCWAEVFARCCCSNNSSPQAEKRPFHPEFCLRQDPNHLIFCKWMNKRNISAPSVGKNLVLSKRWFDSAWHPDKPKACCRQKKGPGDLVAFRISQSIAWSFLAPWNSQLVDSCLADQATGWRLGQDVKVQQSAAKFQLLWPDFFTTPAVSCSHLLKASLLFP